MYNAGGGVEEGMSRESEVEAGKGKAPGARDARGREGHRIRSRVSAKLGGRPQARRRLQPRRRLDVCAVQRRMKGNDH